VLTRSDAARAPLPLSGDWLMQIDAWSAISAGSVWRRTPTSPRL